MKGRFKLRLLGIWIGMLLATIGIRLLATEVEAQSSTLERQREATRAELENIPTRTESQLIELFRESHPEFVQEIHRAIGNQRSRFHECVLLTMTGPVRETEFLDVSFVINIEGIGNSVIEKTEIDRATTRLSQEAEDCVLNTLNNLRLNLPIVVATANQTPKGRIRFPICFNRPKSQD